MALFLPFNLNYHDPGPNPARSSLLLFQQVLVACALGENGQGLVAGQHIGVAAHGQIQHQLGQVVAFGEGDGLTPAMINNYIKDGLLERANGKKYGQEHLAYLTAIGALKQVMSVREMKVLTTVGREMRAPEKQYEYFCKYLDQAP